MNYLHVVIAALVFCAAALAEQKAQETGPGKALLKLVELLKAGTIDEAATLYADESDGRKGRLESLSKMIKSGEFEMTLSDAYEDKDVGAVVVIQKVKGKANASPMSAIKVGDGWKLIEREDKVQMSDEQRQRLKKCREQADAREKELDAQLKSAPKT